MRLSEAESAQFYKLMWRLQLYVNRKRELVRNVDSVEAYDRLSRAEKAEVRNVLVKDTGLIDTYVAENPDSLPADELALVGKWNRCVTGVFYITRFLRKHTVFLSSDGKVYAVLALIDSLQDAFSGRRLPIMVDAVLLPFKGKIIYDGLMGIHNVTFGSGARRQMDATYTTAKEKGLIVETLEPEEYPPPVRTEKKSKPCPDWRPVLDDLVERAAKLKGGPELQRAAFAVLLASARLARDVAYDPEEPLAVRKPGRQTARALTRLLRRAERERAGWL